MTKLKKNRRGAAAIEFALLLPVMMTILLGIIEYGLYFNERQLLQNAKIMLESVRRKTEEQIEAEAEADY